MKKTQENFIYSQQTPIFYYQLFEITRVCRKGQQQANRPSLPAALLRIKFQRTGKTIVFYLVFQRTNKQIHAACTAIGRRKCASRNAICIRLLRLLRRFSHAGSPAERARATFDDIKENKSKYTSNRAFGASARRHSNKKPRRKADHLPDLV